jgi:hypothetical protein
LQFAGKILFLFFSALQSFTFNWPKVRGVGYRFGRFNFFKADAGKMTATSGAFEAKKTSFLICAATKRTKNRLCRGHSVFVLQRTGG